MSRGKGWAKAEGLFYKRMIRAVALALQAGKMTDCHVKNQLFVNEFVRLNNVPDLKFGFYFF